MVKIFSLSVIAIILVDVFSRMLSKFKDRNVVYRSEGKYAKITIYDGQSDGKPTRFFRQDRSSAGAMFLDSDELVFEYTKYYALYKVFTPEVKRALVIGGGAYSIPKALLKDLANATVDVVEIEPSLFELARQYFKVSQTERLNNVIADGRGFLHDTDKKYDLIFSDAFYSLNAIPVHFSTREFFALAKERLSGEGIFIANVIGDLFRQAPSFILSEIKTFQSVFPNSYFFALDAPRMSDQNIIFVGYKSDKKIDFSEPPITKDENPIIQSLGRKNIDLDRFEFSGYPILTDEFCPGEVLSPNVLRKRFGPQEVISGEEMQALINQQARYGLYHEGTSAHRKLQKFLIAELNALTHQTAIQTWQQKSPGGQPCELTNIIGRLNPAHEKRVIVAARYGAKKIADNGAHHGHAADGSASAVSVLLELTRILANAAAAPGVGVDVVFFDGSEGEESQEGGYTRGHPISSAWFARHLREIYGEQKPEGGIVVHFRGGDKVKVLKEQSSIQNAPAQTGAFWDEGEKIDRNVFIDAVGPKIEDDHTPLNQAGIPSFLVTDCASLPSLSASGTPGAGRAKNLETVARAILNYVYAVK